MASKLGNGIYQLLINNATVSSLVGTKVYPNIVPGNRSYPAIVYRIASALPTITKDGNADLDNVTLAVDIYAKEYDEAYQIANAVKDVLDWYDGTSNGETFESFLQSQGDAVWEDEVEQYHLEQDFTVWHNR